MSLTVRNVAWKLHCSECTILPLDAGSRALVAAVPSLLCGKSGQKYVLVLQITGTAAGFEEGWRMGKSPLARRMATGGEPAVQDMFR